MKDSIILTFLKFGHEKHIVDAFDNGTIYMNPIQYFRNIEDEELRGDNYEGVTAIKNFPPGQFEIPSLNFKGNYINFHVRESHEFVLGNIYSLYCISSLTIPSPLDFSIDPKNEKFGTHCLMIKDNKTFMELIMAELNSLKMKYHHGFVSYYDKKQFNGSINLFQKPMEFEYQKEFRFYIENDLTDPLIIKIGCLDKIAEIISMRDIMTLRLTIEKH